MGERICAFVITRENPLTLVEVNEFLHKRGLADYKLPERIQLVKSFPCTDLGSVNKVALREAIASELQHEQETRSGP